MKENSFLGHDSQMDLLVTTVGRDILEDYAIYVSEEVTNGRMPQTFDIYFENAD